LHYTPICAHGPPFDTTPTLWYKPIGILDGGNGNSGSGVLVLKPKYFEYKTMDVTETPNNSTTPTRTRITHRFDSNLKIDNRYTVPQNDLSSVIRLKNIFNKKKLCMIE